MKIEEFRIAHKIDGFEVQRLTTYKVFVSTWFFFGKYVEKQDYFPVDLFGNGIIGKIGWMDEYLKQDVFKDKTTAVSYIHYLIKEYNRKCNHVDKFYYPTFDIEK